MLNRILSKKIKFPPSLRGARRRSNLSGFSLIELMVAVVILALVSFGIFLAFSTAFQSFNDSKDRTIATNYAQQILEDYKDTHFEKIEPFSNLIEDTKYTQNVNVQPVDYNVNLKKVIVAISWKGRNNNPKNVSVSTVIYNTQTIAEADSNPAGITIYANPYNLLPGTDEDAVTSNIFAEIIDGNGNLITDWNESNVNFGIEAVVNLENESQEEFYLGNLSVTSVPLVQGKAGTTFNQYSGEEREGFVEIKATLTIGEVEIYDTLTLKVTNDAVAIVLASNREIISTQAGEETTANLTATIVDAVGDTVVTDREINITIISGPGNFANFIPVSDGVAYIDLISETTAGISTIMATSNLLEPGSINIEIVDPGVNYISVEAVDRTIVQQGETNIIAYLTDYLRNPIEGESIVFSTDYGELSSTSDTTLEDGSATVTLTINNAVTAIVTASWTDGTEITDTVSVLCRNHNLYVYPGDNEIIEGTSTTINAELSDFETTLIADELIYFTIKSGSGSFSSTDTSLISTSDVTNEFGIASVVIYIASPGTTNVEASWSFDSDVTGDVDVICISAPIHEIVLSTDTTEILVGDEPIITATVTEGGNSVGSGTEVTFLLDNYDNARLDSLSSSVNKSTDENGVASVVLSNLVAGEEVTVTAEVGTASDSISITCETPSISIDLADPANIKHGTGGSGKQQVYFDIETNNGSVSLKKMNILWQSDGGKQLNTLYIDDTIVYNGEADSGTTISFNQLPSYTLIENIVYTIKMIFSNDVKQKDWDITFIDPNTFEDISTVSFYLN